MKKYTLGMLVACIAATSLLTIGVLTSCGKQEENDDKPAIPDDASIEEMWEAARKATTEKEFEEFATLFEQRDSGLFFLIQKAIEFARDAKTEGDDAGNANKALLILEQIHSAHLTFMHGLKKDDPLEKMVYAELLANERHRDGIAALISIAEESDDPWIVSYALTQATTTLDELCMEAGYEKDPNSTSALIIEHKNDPAIEYRDPVIIALKKQLELVEFDKKGFAAGNK